MGDGGVGDYVGFGFGVGGIDEDGTDVGVLGAGDITGETIADHYGGVGGCS